MQKLYKFLTVSILLLYSWGHAQIGNAACNLREPLVNITGKFNNLTAAVGGSGICVRSVSNSTFVTDNNLTNSATVNMTGIGCSEYISVKDNDVADTYPAGTFAGYRIASGGLIGASLSATIKVDTYNNNVFQETVYQTSSIAGLNSTLVAGDGTAQVGGVSTKDFDEIRITYTSLIGFFYSAEVMYPIIKKYCPGPVLQCATTYRWSNTQFPVELVTQQTGLVGGAIGSVTNAYNVISPDPTDFATVNINVGLFGAAEISVEDVLSTYQPGTFAGFDINSTSISFEFFNSVQIKTYLNGVEQEVSTSAELFDIADIPGRKTVGFITTKPFDEIKIVLNQVAGFNIGSIQVFNPVVAIPVVPPPILSQSTTVKCTTSATTVNLNSFVTGTAPANSVIRWFDGPDPLTSSQIADPAGVTAVKSYYAFYFNTITNCYSVASVFTFFPDSDCDGQADTVDLDDDNDGILDSVEGYTCGSDLVINDPNPSSTNIFTAPPTKVTLTENTSSAATVFTYSAAEFPYGGGKVIDPGSIGSKVTYTFAPHVINLEFWLMDFDNQEIVNINYYDANGNRIANLLPYVTQTVSTNVGSLGLTNNATYGLTTNPTNNIGSHTPMQDMISIKTPFYVSKIEIYFSAAANPSATPDYFIKAACAGIDTDADGIPDYLDLDSDSDGCLDAIEGDENVIATQLNASGSISGAVDAQGVPVLVNASGAADSGGDQGQGIGQSRDITKNDCLNSDGDSLPDWQDLDDDNDGILDTTENTCNLTGASGGHLFWDLDTQVFPGGLRGNSLAPDVTGTVVSFGPGLSGTTGANAWDFKILNSTSIAEAKANDDYVQFTIPLSSTATKIYEITQWSTYGYSANLGPKIEYLRIEIADNAAFSNPSILYNGANPTIPGSAAFYTTNLAAFKLQKGITYYVRVYIYGSNASGILDSFGLYFKCYTDTDTDGIPDYLDLDSDNDGCLDALEGGKNLPVSALVAAGGTVTVGLGSTAPNQNLGNTVDANGVPTIVAGGQSAGTSANSTVKAAVCLFCYKPATTTGTALPTNHGITALGRAGSDNGNWPMVRTGAWTVLEAKTKGFVINRIATTAAVTAISNPVIGMMVYDAEADCLKINTDGTSSGWKCFNTQTCP